MRNNNISQIGIMFDQPAKSSADWPTLDEVVHYSCDDAPDFAGWLAIASDPNRLRYFDDDAQAMDETNWDAIVAELPEPAETVNSATVYSRSVAGPIDMSVEAKELGFGEYHDTFETFLIVDPANEELLDAMLNLRRSLSDYPLLDESTYSDREWNAWQDFVADGLRYDTLRELNVDDDTGDAIADAWDEVAGAAAQHLDYYYGFTGEHSPDFSECVAHAIGDALVGLARVALA